MHRHTSRRLSTRLQSETQVLQPARCFQLSCGACDLEAASTFVRRAILDRECEFGP